MQKEDLAFKLVFSCFESFVVQCNLDYPDLVYPDPQLSGLAREAYFQIIRYLNFIYI